MKWSQLIFRRLKGESFCVLLRKIFKLNHTPSPFSIPEIDASLSPVEPMVVLGSPVPCENYPGVPQIPPKFFIVFLENFQVSPVFPQIY